MTKENLLKSLYERYRLKFQGQEIVLGDGKADAGLVLVGEAPGKDEVRLSKPFVGMAGKNLSEFLDILGVSRDSIYITNAIKYRLAAISKDTGRLVNRPAARSEIEDNRSYLLEELKIINPKFIVTLGNVPLRSVTGDYSISIGAVHGRILKMQIMGGEYEVYPLYHPASIIYNRDLKSTYIDDIKSLKSIIHV